MSYYSIKSSYQCGERDEALKCFPEEIEYRKDRIDELSKLAFLAADFAHPEALRLLFEAGMPPTVTGDHNFTLLHYLAAQKDSGYGRKPAGAVAETTALLLDNNVSVLRKDDDKGMTCYHYAAQNGVADMVETLVDRGAKLNMTDKDGNTAIHIACDHAKHAVYRLELERNGIESSKKKFEEKVNRQKELGMTDEQIAEYVEEWVHEAPDKVQKRCEDALRRVEDYFRTVKAFAEGGVDIDERNRLGESALDLAVESRAKKIAAFLSGTLTGDDDEAAIAAGGMTLHQAAEKDDAEAIKAIVGAGADPNALKDGEKIKFGGCTPLAIAIANFNENAVDALLSCGADPSFRDGDGRAALLFMLVPYVKVYPNEKTMDRIPKMIKSMLIAGFDADQAIDDKGNTLLIAVCKSQHGIMTNNRCIKVEVIKELLKLGCDVNRTNMFGETALMHACAFDFLIMENFQIDLLERGADVSLVDKKGDTALHYAARNENRPGAKALCDMLLEFGADAKAVNNLKKTALDLAVERENESLAKLLIKKM